MRSKKKKIKLAKKYSLGETKNCLNNFNQAQLGASQNRPSLKCSYPVVSNVRNVRYQTLEGTQWLDDIVSTVKYFLIIYVLGRLNFGFKLGNR